MKQHTTPMIIKGGRAQKLEKVSLNSKTYNEDWIQELCFQNPSILPIEEIEPTFSGMIPVCRELRTESGFVDLIFINEYGFITVGECKLWRDLLWLSSTPKTDLVTTLLQPFTSETIANWINPCAATSPPCQHI